MVCTVGEGREKKMGSGKNCAVAGNLTAAAHLFPLLTPNAVHHSAYNDRSWRNLLRLIANFPKTAYFKLSISTVQVEKIRVCNILLFFILMGERKN